MVPMPTLDVEVGIKTLELKVEIPVKVENPVILTLLPKLESPLKVETPVTRKVVLVTPIPETFKLLEIVENPVTDKLSSIVTKPPKESIVKFPEVVSISLSPLIPIWILSI